MGLLGNSTGSAAAEGQVVSKKRSFNSVLLSNFLSEADFEAGSKTASFAHFIVLFSTAESLGVESNLNVGAALAAAETEESLGIFVALEESNAEITGSVRGEGFSTFSHEAFHCFSHFGDHFVFEL